FRKASRAKNPQEVPVSNACVGFTSSPVSFHFDCDITATRTGAFEHQTTFPSFIKDRNFSRSVLDRAKINLHGCTFAADGAQRALSKRQNNTPFAPPWFEKPVLTIYVNKWDLYRMMLFDIYLYLSFVHVPPHILSRHYFIKHFITI